MPRDGHVEERHRQTSDKKTPKPQKAARVPFYSTHRRLCPNHPIMASSKALVGKPCCPCACTNPVPIARQSHFALAGTLPSANAGAILEIERFLKHFDQFTRVRTWKRPCQCKVRLSCDWNGISTCAGRVFQPNLSNSQLEGDLGKSACWFEQNGSSPCRGARF